MPEAGDAVTEDRGLLVGPSRVLTSDAFARRPYQQERSRGSVIDPQAAGRLGLRGPQAGGMNLLNLFVPVLIHAFGQEWWETGSISLYFDTGVVSGEQVEAVAEQPRAGQREIRAWVRRSDDPLGQLATGTASIGGDTTYSELHLRDLKGCDPSLLRILTDISPGQVLSDAVVMMQIERHRASLEAGAFAGPREWFERESPWGGPIGLPSTVTSLTYQLQGVLAERLNGVPFMSGASEIAFVAGPLFLEHPYHVRSVALAVGQSARTEFCWYDVTVEDESGRLVAKLRQLHRVLKAGAPQYADES